MPKLTILNDIFSYFDVDATSQPQLQMFNWNKNLQVDVENPASQSFNVGPGEAFTVFNELLITAIDGTTQFTLTLSPLSPTTYRFTNTVGTPPAFRVARSLIPSGKTYTITINLNQTVGIASSTVGDFTAVQPGDVFFVPGPTTGDAATPFSPLNQGYWTVLSKDGPGTVLQLTRPVGAIFEAAGEVILATANSQLQAYGTAGIQVGDSVVISAGFPISVQLTYQITAIDPSWFEVVETTPLPVNISAIPGTSGIAFYGSSKRYIKIETDQEAAIRVNGATDNIQRLSPWAPGDSKYIAEYTRTGPCWSLVVVNLSTTSMKLKVFSAE